MAQSVASVDAEATTRAALSCWSALSAKGSTTLSRDVGTTLTVHLQNVVVIRSNRRNIKAVTGSDSGKEE